MGSTTHATCVARSLTLALLSTPLLCCANCSGSNSALTDHTHKSSLCEVCAFWYKRFKPYVPRFLSRTR
ncbi:RxLR-like protein [Plasmopara halstedii]|uniref:RxLR-like protein n=1 Tax=Plasmopara halstedii TaxID=4781 RepID=A0A0N7L488_PLAHL|nr:RxLR-like protein [Plasmopara halstedii]CEG37995.1 RxLR-like protein [Plasmopara halstedii]|eukprot:XP_024574364.1 RxLR-like protein [Plasmopara halstedii]